MAISSKIPETRLEIAASFLLEASVKLVASDQNVGSASLDPTYSLGRDHRFSRLVEPEGHEGLCENSGKSCSNERLEV